MEDLRDYAINYLYNSGFVNNYTKKLMFPSDIDSLYDDYLGEVYLAICELPYEKWQALYNSSINKGKDFEYEIRNFISVLIRNTVRSDTSAAYRKLKKPSTVFVNQDDETWKIYSNTIAEEGGPHYE